MGEFKVECREDVIRFMQEMFFIMGIVLAVVVVFQIVGVSQSK